MTIENGYVNVAGNGKTQTYSTNLQHKLTAQTYSTNLQHKLTAQTYSTNLQHNLTAQRHRKTEPHKNAWRELVRAKCAQEITVND
jgi:hypothetical protein